MIYLIINYFIIGYIFTFWLFIDIDREHGTQYVDGWIVVVSTLMIIFIWPVAFSESNYKVSRECVYDHVYEVSQ